MFAPSDRIIGDKGYRFLESRGTTPVIPNKINCKALFPFARPRESEENHAPCRRSIVSVV